MIKTLEYKDKDKDKVYCDDFLFVGSPTVGFIKALREAAPSSAFLFLARLAADISIAFYNKTKLLRKHISYNI